MHIEILRYNNDRFMAKELRKAIMLRSKFLNTYNKDKTHFNWQKHKHQRNFCLNILRKTKEIFCQIKC